MSTRTILAIFLALMCGAAAAWGVRSMSGTRTVEVKAETTPILVAAVDIKRGKSIAEGDLKTVEWPKASAPEEALADLEAVTGRVAMMDIMAGDPVLELKLSSEEAGRGLAALIPEKMRAYTIQTTAVSSTVAGLILPGNHVDVLLHIPGNKGAVAGGGVTRALMQSVEILAVGQIMQAPAAEDKVPGDVRSVTLLVTPEEASVLDVATKIGTLTLSLRNPVDLETADTPPAFAADIQFREESPLGDSPSATGETTMLGALTKAFTTFIAKTGEAGAKSKAQPKVSDIVTLRGNARGLIHVKEFP